MKPGRPRFERLSGGEGGGEDDDDDDGEEEEAKGFGLLTA